MGLSSIIKGIVSALTRDNSTNSRALTAWADRATTIAENLEHSNDTERQSAFQATITTIAGQLSSTSGKEPDSIPSRLSPISQSKRATIILNGDEELDDYEQPPPTRKQEMMRSLAEDEEELFVNLKGLENAGDGLLADLSEPVDSPMYRANNQTEASTLLSPGWAQPSTSSSKNQLEPSNEQPAGWRAEGSNAYAQFVKRTTTKRERVCFEPTIKFYISEMEIGTEDGALIMEVNVSYSHTFADLSNIILDSDLNRPLPDFWLRKRSREKNRVTNSGAWWEWQRPRFNVSEAIQQQQRGRSQDSSVGLKSVVKTGEYVVLLVNKDERECEIPTEIPRELRRKTLQYFQESVFRNESVRRVLELESGKDASDVVFDGNWFCHKTNPLFVDVRTKRHELREDRTRRREASVERV